MKRLTIIFFLTIAFFSCNEVKKETPTEQKEATTKETAAVYKSIEVEIEGMTCEIGCARTIQSKLSKVDGVTFAKVDFESKKGQFTFDTHKVSKNEIIKKIDGIAGGDIYSVTNTKELPEIIN